MKTLLTDEKIRKTSIQRYMFFYEKLLGQKIIAYNIMKYNCSLSEYGP